MLQKTNIMKYSQNSTEPSEIMIGIIGPIGCNRKMVIDAIAKLARHFDYNTEIINVSKIIEERVFVPICNNDEYIRVSNLMDAGNRLRKETTNSILAQLSAVKIAEFRTKHEENRKYIYIIDSLKHPDEVHELKNIYGRGFYLFAIHSSEEMRIQYLADQCLIQNGDHREGLIKRDKDEHIGNGQSTSEAFHLADFFLTEDGNHQKVWNSIKRFLDIIFGDPFKTPTFHEYAMYMAYASAMRSADMSRQVGAILADETDIISTGANECPKAFGGTYWPLFDDKKNIIYDVKDGRDYMRDCDFNAKEKKNIIKILTEGITGEDLKKLKENINKSDIKYLTEYGRVVHAEMNAILGCARRGISCKDATLFCTTFPCHNCAKHILASGIKHVVFIEPYPKSKAIEMHGDAIEYGDKQNRRKVVFSPFVGVGPRQFVNFFSLSLSIGEKIRRKEKGDYRRVSWERKCARPRVKMYPVSYIDNENSVKQESAQLILKAGKLSIC